ncbi:Cytochrome c oxidase assembly protein cox19 [Actinomortierella ambigua]|uniref:Cytochrome c oxidase assembly protein cox19 n=1 Tax=Actinomortierella ambigua TaxID=1343610 RepID=A0A9P6U1R8_9FUNG|nr:Cytochrome c oxidase assembly protein cox19 [Actinomortierella ambigua]
MQAYLSCLKENQNNNGKCREFSREYLECRMQRGLMGRDSFDNLGYGDLEKGSQTQNRSAEGKSPVGSGSPSSAEVNTSPKSAPDTRPGVEQPTKAQT